MDERIRMLDGPYRRVYASANDAVCSVLPNFAAFAAANENLQRQLQRGSNFGPMYILRCLSAILTNNL